MLQRVGNHLAACALSYCAVCVGFMAFFKVSTTTGGRLQYQDVLLARSGADITHGCGAGGSLETGGPKQVAVCHVDGAKLVVHHARVKDEPACGHKGSRSVGHTNIK